MSEQKDQKHFERQRNRFNPAPGRRNTQKEDDLSSQQSSQFRHQQSIRESHSTYSVSTSQQGIPQKAVWSLSKATHDSLRKLITANKDNFNGLLKNKVLRQELRREQRRLTKVRKAQKLSQQTDSQLSILSINNILNVAQQVILQFLKEEGKTPPKNVIRASQEKQMTKILSTIEEKLSQNDIFAAKPSIQNLLKRFAKDQFLESKIAYLTSIQQLIQINEKESILMKENQHYLEKLSNLEYNPEPTQQLANSLKSIKKQLSVPINRQNKKAQPNKQLINNLTAIDKITSALIANAEPKGEKKGIRRQPSQSKELPLKGVSHSTTGADFYEQAVNYCKDLLEKTGQDKQALFKQLQVLKRNKKKSTEAPYNLILKLSQFINGQKKDAIEVNTYLKSVSQLYMKKTFSAEQLQSQIQKLDKKYGANQILSQIKPNLEYLVSTVQQKQKSGKDLTALQNDIKKIKTENQKLHLCKTIQEQKGKLGTTEGSTIDKKKQMEQKRLKQAEKVKAQKLEKDIDRTLDNVFLNLNEKKWKPSKTAINVFIKKFEQTSNPIIPKSIQSLNAINNLISQVQSQEAKLLELQKQQKAIGKEHQKEKSILEHRLKQHEEYQNLLKDLCQHFTQDKYPMKKFFDQLKRDRKKIVQDRYMMLNKLEEPLSLWRSKKSGDHGDRNVSLTFSSVSAGSVTERSRREKTEGTNQAENQLARLNKEIEQLLNVINKMKIEEEWSKLVPKNTKSNQTFKPVYDLLRSLKQESDKQKQQLDRINDQRLSLHRKLSDRQRSSSQVQQSAKKSTQLRSSRRSSRSRDRREDKSKQLVQSYIQDERNYLDRIGEAQKEKQHLSEEIQSLDFKAKSFEQDLMRSEQKVQQLQKIKADLERQKIKQFNEINSLRGQLQIAQGRIQQIQSKLESQVHYYKELSEQVSSKIVEESSKSKELENQNLALRNNLQKIRANSQQGQSEASERPIPVKRGRNEGPNLNFDLDLDSEHVFELYDTKPKTSRRKPRKVQPQHSQKKTQAPTQLSQDINWEDRASELAHQLQVLQEKLAYLQSQSQRQQLTISDITTENNELKIQISTFHQKDQTKIYLTEIQGLKAEISSLKNQLSRLHNQNVSRSPRKTPQERQNDIRKKVQIEINTFMSQQLPTILHEKQQQWWQAQQRQRQIFLQNAKKEWQVHQEEEWAAKEATLQQYWHNRFAELQSNWKQQMQQKIQETSSTSKQLNNVELLQILRREQNRTVVQVLIDQQYAQWQNEKNIALKTREKQVQDHFNNIIIPRIRTQWDEQKRVQVQALLKNQSNSEQIIQNWKNMFLGSIIEQQRNGAIDWFIKEEVPKIIDHEYNIWIQNHQNAQTEEIIKQQWSIWNQQQQEERQKDVKKFEGKIHQIEIDYQAQLIEWQEKVINQQRRITQIEQTLKRQRGNWIQEKKQLNSPSKRPEVASGHEQRIKKLTSQLEQSSEREKQLNQKIKVLEESFTQRLSVECERVLKDRGTATEKLIQQTQRKTQKEWVERIEVQRVNALKKAQEEFNFKIDQLRSEWQKEHKQEIEDIVSIQLQKFEAFKNEQFDRILIQDRKQIQRFHQERLEKIINTQRENWIKEREIINQTQQKQPDSNEINRRIESEIQARLGTLKSQIEKKKQVEWKNWFELEKSAWEGQSQKNIQAAKRQWEQTILVQRQKEWKANQNQAINEAVQKKVLQIQREYEQAKIPSILDEKYRLWIEENSKNLELQRKKWLAELPELINDEQYRVYFEPYLREQSSTTQQNLQSLTTQLHQAQSYIKQLQSQKAHSQHRLRAYESRIQETIRQNEIISQELQRIAAVYQQQSSSHTQHQVIGHHYKTIEDLSKSRYSETEVSQLKKIIQKQKEDIRHYSMQSTEIQMLKKEVLSLKEAKIAIQNSKWIEISQLRQKYDVQIMQLSNQRNTLISKISNNQTVRVDSIDRQSILSYERQIATLLATIKTKDTQISFLKRSIDSHKEELKQARDQYSQVLQLKSGIERQLAEVKNSKIQLEYELKYLREKEETLKKKIQAKENELVSIRKKQTYQSHVTTTKIKTNVDILSSYQARFTEIEGALSLKTQECQSMSIEIDRLRYDVQRSQAAVHSANLELQGLRMHLKDSESHFTKLKIEFERNQEELGRVKLALNQSLARQQDANKQLQIQVRAVKHEEGERMRLETENHRLNDQVNKLWKDFNESQKATRFEAERVIQLQRQFTSLRESRAKQMDNTQLQMLNKINKQVTELTSVNHQLTMKLVVYENYQHIMAFSQDILRFFLLVQKHTDLLVDYLHREKIIPKLEPYHRFLSENRPYIASGQISMYFSKWQVLLRQLFDACVRSRADDMREQAQELMRMKEEMNDILEKQIEASENESGQLVEDYKSVLIDIKSLVRQYMNSGDKEYLNLLCSSLGISQVHR